MKKINAKGVLIMMTYILAFFVPFSIFFICDTIRTDYNKKSDLICVTVFFVGIIIWMILNGRMLYKRHWIMYGNNKIIVSRFTKKIEERNEFGKWKTRVDELSVDDIEKCGSSIALGRKVEWHWSNGMSFEYSFILKDGRKIGFEGLYFTKNKKEELSNYIFEKTGIKAAEYSLK